MGNFISDFRLVLMNVSLAQMILDDSFYSRQGKISPSKALSFHRFTFRVGFLRAERTRSSGIVVRVNQASSA